jgi:hypothetical protein
LVNAHTSSKSISVYIYRHRSPLTNPAPNQSATVVEYNELSSTTETNPVLCKARAFVLHLYVLPDSPNENEANQEPKDFRSDPDLRVCRWACRQTAPTRPQPTGQVLARRRLGRPSFALDEDGKKEMACRIISVAADIGLFCDGRL